MEEGEAGATAHQISPEDTTNKNRWGSLRYMRYALWRAGGRTRYVRYALCV